MKGSTSSSPENGGSADADSPPPSTGRASPLMPSGMTTPPSSTAIPMFRPQQMGAFSPPATSTPTSNTVLSVSSSPPSSLLNCPTADHHLSQHLTLAERMSMSLLSHHAARPMNLLCAPQPKVRQHLRQGYIPFLSCSWENAIKLCWFSLWKSREIKKKRKIKHLSV